MHCWSPLVHILSAGLVLGGLNHLLRVGRCPYGRYVVRSGTARMVPAKVAWLVQELPALLVPLGLLLGTRRPPGLGPALLLGTFCLHYFHRTFVYSLLTRGQPYPLRFVLEAGLFCSVNGFLQAHYLLHCTRYDRAWASDARFGIGLTLFILGMAINIHSDYILCNLRKPGEVVYKIPQGGLFRYVSGANYFGEIVEWLGYAVATWSVPALSFALFSACFIGPRAYHHHRFYHEKFKDYPKCRKALVPFMI